MRITAEQGPCNERRATWPMAIANCQLPIASIGSWLLAVGCWPTAVAATCCYCVVAATNSAKCDRCSDRASRIVNMSASNQPQWGITRSRSLRANKGRGERWRQQLIECICLCGGGAMQQQQQHHQQQHHQQQQHLDVSASVAFALASGQMWLHLGQHRVAGFGFHVQRL